jgi:large subunit ribosomal protein L17
MRHSNIGRKLGVDAPHRLAMMRSLTLALIEHETIKTTPARAKELRWWADHVVTLAKKGDLASRRRIVQLLGSTQTYKPGENRVRMAIERVYTELAPRFKDRTGGYTQMFRLALRRPGDNSEMCLMRYLPGDAKADKGETKGKAASAKSKAGAKKKAPKKDAPAKKAAKAKA